MQAATLARRLVDVLAEKQAEDIILLDISEVATFADYFVIASAANVRQMQALLETLEQTLDREAVRALGREGTIDSGWLLVDIGDIIVHLFSPEERAYYGIERLWSRGVPVLRIQ